MMKAFGLYWIRALTLGAGLNITIVSLLMGQMKWTFHQSVAVGTLVSVNTSFFADRLIFGKKKKKPPIMEPCSLHTPHACPGCQEYPCVCPTFDAIT